MRESTSIINPEKVQDGFWDLIDKRPTGCWEYRQKAPNGYGRYMKKYAHRISWILTNGAIPNGLCVLHKCDNRPCVNPDHLFIGTKKDNAEDRENKGRGGRVPISSLHRGAMKRRSISQEDAEFICLARKCSPKIKLRILAARFKMSVQTISLIASGKIYKTYNDV